MRKSKEKSLEIFWSILAQLKREPRRGWTRKLNLSAPESVADHSFAVAMLCLLVAERRGGYETERLLRLALLHDLDEVFTGDLTPEDKRRMGRRVVARARENARKRILAAIPEESRTEWAGLWTDLSRRRTKEAKLVKDVDSLEMAFQARDYENRGAKRVDVREFYNSAFESILDHELRQTVAGFLERTRERR